MKFKKEALTWTGNVCHDDVLEEPCEVELDVARLDALRLDHLLRGAQRQHHRLVDLPPLQKREQKFTQPSTDLLVSSMLMSNSPHWMVCSKMSGTCV